MAKYNMIDTATLDRFNTVATRPVSDTALGIALCMPSVSEGGVRAQRGGLVSGYQAYYHARALGWGDGDVTAGCADIEFFAVQQATGGSPSNKTNHLKWLTQAGLITVDRRNGQRFSRLTDAGVAQVKAVGGNELAKLAKAFTTAAYDKAHKALAKAAQPVKASKPRKAKAAAVEPVSDTAIEFSGITDNVADMIGNVADNANNS